MEELSQLRSTMPPLQVEVSEFAVDLPDERSTSARPQYYVEVRWRDKTFRTNTREKLFDPLASTKLFALVGKAIFMQPPPLTSSDTLEFFLKQCEVFGDRTLATAFVCVMSLPLYRRATLRVQADMFHFNICPSNFGEEILSEEEKAASNGVFICPRSAVKKKREKLPCAPTPAAPKEESAHQECSAPPAAPCQQQQQLDQGADFVGSNVGAPSQLKSVAEPPQSLSQPAGAGPNEKVRASARAAVRSLLSRQPPTQRPDPPTAGNVSDRMGQERAPNESDRMGAYHDALEQLDVEEASLPVVARGVAPCGHLTYTGTLPPPPRRDRVPQVARRYYGDGLPGDTSLWAKVVAAVRAAANEIVDTVDTELMRCAFPDNSSPLLKMFSCTMLTEDAVPAFARMYVLFNELAVECGNLRLHLPYSEIAYICRRTCMGMDTLQVFCEGPVRRAYVFQELDGAVSKATAMLGIRQQLKTTEAFLLLADLWVNANEQKTGGNVASASS